MPPRRLFDCQGRAVPKRLAKAFRARAEAEKFIGKLADWRKQLRERAKEIEWDAINHENLLRYISLIQYELMDGLPYVICPCGQVGQCEKCGGRGWVTQTEYTNATMSALEGLSPIAPPPTTTSPCTAN